MATTALVKKLGRDLIGKSPSMKRLRSMIARIAPTDIQVLIKGEPGTGRSYIARIIHQYSSRKEHPFVVVNLGGIPASIAPSELFGHVRGAFTGASTRKQGLIAS